MTDGERLLRELYDAFNARDVDAVIDRFAADVDWPNAWEGGRVHGRDAVREYWRRQWAAIVPTVTPVAFAERAGGRIAVDVDQVVRSHDGALLGEGRVVHVWELRDGVVVRMDVEEPGA